MKSTNLQLVLLMFIIGISVTNGQLYQKGDKTLNLGVGILPSFSVGTTAIPLALASL